jgi:hypothetical protein
MVEYCDTPHIEREEQTVNTKYTYKEEIILCLLDKPEC